MMIHGNLPDQNDISLLVRVTFQVHDIADLKKTTHNVIHFVSSISFSTKDCLLRIIKQSFCSFHLTTEKRVVLTLHSNIMCTITNFLLNTDPILKYSFGQSGILFGQLTLNHWRVFTYMNTDVRLSDLCFFKYPSFCNY